MKPVSVSQKADRIIVDGEFWGGNWTLFYWHAEARAEALKDVFPVDQITLDEDSGDVAITVVQLDEETHDKAIARTKKQIRAAFFVGDTIYSRWTNYCALQQWVIEKSLGHLWKVWEKCAS